MKNLFNFKKPSMTRAVYNSEYARFASRQSLEHVYSALYSHKRGLSEHDVESRRRKFGENIVVHEERTNAMKLFVSAFINPFIGVLTALILISFVLDVVLAEPGEQDWTTIIIISTMVIFSAILRFVQELKAGRSSDALLKMVKNTCYVERTNNDSGEIPVEELVPGDVVLLSAGDMIPADLRIVETKDFFVSQSSLTGESESIEKAPLPSPLKGDGRGAIVGPKFEQMNDEEKRVAVRDNCIFAKLTPHQKTEIITLLQEQDNTVGFLGDGINDAAALRQSDIGISVDSAVDIAKESADIILLEKDLMVLEQGVLSGRETFGNIIKYVKMTASSNFGNMFSVLAASAFLPFLPMLSIHLLIQNLLYDISQTAIPFDKMDKEFLLKPRRWDSSDIARFMIFIGPISSIFDIATYLLMWYVFGCQSPEAQTLFQSGWFIEGLLSQTLIVHMIRTRRIPFVQSNAAWPLMLMTFAIMAIGIIIPFTSFGSYIGLMPLPLSYFPWLIAILLSYCVLTQVIKQWYIKKFGGKWL